MERLDDAVAKAWIERYHRVEMGLLDLTSDAPDETDWAYQMLDTFCRSDSDRALSIIQLIGRMDNSDFISENLAAGPLETLLMWNAARVIDRVELLASQDDRFRSLLGGVWRNAIPLEIWNRIERACEG